MKKSSSDDITCDIITLAGRFTSHSDLQRYADKQFITLDKASKRIKELEEQVSSLTAALNSVSTAIDSTVEKIIITPEQAICDAQIAVLRDRSLNGMELTLEEIKKLDLLIKNKRLAKEQSTAIEGKARQLPVPNSQLIQIASQMEKFVEEG